MKIQKLRKLTLVLAMASALAGSAEAEWWWDCYCESGNEAYGACESGGTASCSWCYDGTMHSEGSCNGVPLSYYCAHGMCDQFY